MKSAVLAWFAVALSCVAFAACSQPDTRPPYLNPGGDSSVIVVDSGTVKDTGTVKDSSTVKDTGTVETGTDAAATDAGQSDAADATGG